MKGSNDDPNIESYTVNIAVSMEGIWCTKYYKLHDKNMSAFFICKN